MPKVNYVRTEVTELTPRWTIIRDCISGSRKIKEKGTEYLPKPNPSDTSQENTDRYTAYKTRAVFYAVTGRTLRGLVGQVFARDPVAVMPDLMNPISVDADGGGVSLDQQSKKCLGHTVAHGRAFLLVDYPATDRPATRAEQVAGNIRPTINLYDPWDVINWRTTTIGSKKLLSLVVISESQVTDDDGFEQEYQQLYRVLRLRDGIYYSEVWKWSDEINDFVLIQRYVPLNGSGQPWNEIPGTFVGPENNDPTPDLPPLYDLAELNIAHYRNSADYEEASYIVGQPTPYFAGLTEKWVKEVLKGTIPLGARAAVALPEGASAGLLQAEPNSMPREAMEHKEKQMVALGAKLVEQKAVQRTATEAGIDEASTTSLLATAAKNVSSAYTACLKWAAVFMGITFNEETDIDYALNTDFDISRLPAAEVQAIIAAWQSNAITFEEMRDNLVRGGRAYLGDEAAREQMETDGAGLGLPVHEDAKARADAAAAGKANQGGASE